MIRFFRMYSLKARGPASSLAAAMFALGLLAGGAIGSWTGRQITPAEAEPAPVPSLAQATISSPRMPAEVLRVIDGDTFEARVHVWPGLDVTTKVRLRGIDAPEMKAMCAQERVQAEAARETLRTILAEGEVGVFGVTLDKYGGRVVADAATRATANVSSALLAKGLARTYAGGRRRGWCGAL
jgi:endonuclease YncB( thermonuclease family)